MNEITLRTDLEVGAATINCGIEPRTGFQLRRRFNSYNVDTQSKEHTVTFEEWLIASDGKVYDRFYRIKQFKAVNITDVTPNKLRYNQWFATFWNQFGTQINNFISNIPLTSENVEVVQ